MILKQAVIDGFGKWYDETIDFQAEGVTCLFGNNESGKSTLYQFILFMLFGLPPKKREWYRPKTGAKMGGRLIVVDETIGEYTIERYDAVKNGAAVCYTEDGKTHDEEWLSMTWNGMTYATYQSIFSFAANDLAGIDEMKGTDLGNILLHIGLTGSKNIQKIEKQLENQMGDLFKPYGKKPVINEQLATLNESFHTLRQAEQEEAAYREKKEKLFALETEQQQLKTSLQTAKQSLTASEKKWQALPHMQQYHDNAEQLAAYPDVIAFPEDGINRLKAVKEQLLPLKSEQAVLRDSLQTYQDNQQQLRENQYDPSVYYQASELLEKSKTYMDKTKEQTQLQDTKQQKEMELATRLKQLNAGITKEELGYISLSFYTEDTWNKLANDIHQIKREWEQYEQEKRAANRQKEALAEEKADKQAHVLSENALQDVKNTVENYGQQSAPGQAEKNKKWQTWKHKRQTMANYTLIASVVLALISSIMLWSFHMEVLFIVPVLIVLAGGLFHFGTKRSVRSMEEVFNLESDQASPGITEKAYKEAKQQLANHERYTAELAAIKEQIRKNDGYLLTLSERENTLEVKQARLDQRTEEQYAMYPFLEQVEITYWLPLYYALQQVLNLYGEVNQLIDHCTDLQQYKAPYKQQINMFFQEKNRESARATIEQQTEQLEQMITDYQETNNRIKQYEGLIQEQTKQLKTVNRRLSVYEQEQEALYQAAEVTTEEGFFQQAKQRDDKHAVDTKLTEIKDQLSSFFASEEWKKLRSETWNEQQLAADKEEYQSLVDTYESELENNRQKIADLSADISKLETSEKYSELLHRHHMEREKLEKWAERWSVLKTAKALLEETKQDYQKKYIGKVMEKTTDYFQTLTSQLYREVLVPEDGSFMQVVAVDGLHYAVHELSKGTTDQLYVSLRLAISEAMMEEHGFPFIIDDAFVHFDTLRTGNIMKILGEMAEKQQIIVLSCKEDVKNSVCNGKVICLEKTVRISS